jgi:hypothetical protein
MAAVRISTAKHPLIQALASGSADALKKYIATLDDNALFELHREIRWLWLFHGEDEPLRRKATEAWRDEALTIAYAAKEARRAAIHDKFEAEAAALSHAELYRGLLAKYATFWRLEASSDYARYCNAEGRDSLRREFERRFGHMIGLDAEKGSS